MPAQTETKQEKQTVSQSEKNAAPAKTVVGWHGVRCVLPPDWNVTGFSMDRDSGYLRIDAPADSAMTVQIRWSLASAPPGPPNLYSALAPHFRRWFKKPEPVLPKPDLKTNLEKFFKESAKQAKKAKTAFETSLKPEKTEGEKGERTAINFSWTGAGRGQGKIWYCDVCKRIMVVQVVGLAKEHQEINGIASQLFASLHCHSIDGYDLWALYDMVAEVPDDFRLDEQKLLSGYLHLAFTRYGERIVIDRWGLANMTLKKFTVEEWFVNNAFVNIRKLTTDEVDARGHAIVHKTGSLPLTHRLRALKDVRLAFRRFPTSYEGGAWECGENNKLFVVQTMHSRRTETLWAEVVKRCVCH